jgi:hypothetical protein
MRKVVFFLLVLLLTLVISAFAYDMKLQRINNKMAKQLQFSGEVNVGALIYQILVELEQDQQLSDKLKTMQKMVVKLFKIFFDKNISIVNIISNKFLNKFFQIFRIIYFSNLSAFHLIF